jgi:antitoxin PrlF
MTNVSRSVKGHRARLTSQGQITVPKAIRDALRAQPGDEIEFVARGDALMVQLRRRRSVLDFAGLASSAAGNIPATARELDEAIQRGLTENALARAAGGRSGRRISHRSQ